MVYGMVSTLSRRPYSVHLIFWKIFFASCFVDYIVDCIVSLMMTYA